MAIDLKTDILKTLAGSSSQQPVDMGSLYALGTLKRVQEALLELYQAQQIACCKITTRGKPPIQLSPEGRKGERENPLMIERVVWWEVGGIRELPRYGTGTQGTIHRNGRTGC